MATTVGAFNHSASLFAQAYGDGRVKVFDTATGKAVQDLLPTAHLRTTVCSLAWNKPKSSKLKAQTLALGCENGAVDVFSLASGECIHSLEGTGKSAALCSAFSSDGTHATLRSPEDRAGESVWIGYGNGLALQFGLATGDRINKLKVSRCDFQPLVP